MNQSALDSLNAIMALLVGTPIAGSSGPSFGVFTVVGFALVIGGLVMLKKHTEDKRTWPLGFCVSTLVAGGLLTLSDWFFDAISFTVFGATGTGPVTGLSPLAIDPAALQTQMNQVIGSVGFSKFIPQSAAQGVWMIVYLMGVWAYLKGLWKLRYAGDPNSGPQGKHTVGSAIFHILGGFALINITQVGELLSDFLGFT